MGAWRWCVHHNSDCVKGGDVFISRNYNMFDEHTVKQLKDLIRELRTHHNIAGYSRMKKHELIAELNARFILEDGRIFLKGESPSRHEETQPKLSAKQAELKRRINTFLDSLSHEEIYKRPLRETMKLFMIREHVDLGAHKEFFKDVARKYLTTHKD